MRDGSDRHLVTATAARALSGLLCVLVLLAWHAPLPAASSASFERIRVELLSDVARVAPGEPFQVAVRLQPDSGWGTYWRNPGRAGLPTQVDWTLPEGASVGPLQWPVPDRISAQGVTSYGYKREVALLARVTPPPSLAAGERFRVTADVEWLACASICIPGEARLDLTLPVGRPALPRDGVEAVFAEARRQLPTDRPQWAVRHQPHDPGRVALTVAAGEAVFRGVDEARFFPHDSGVIVPEKPQALLDADPTRLRLALPLEQGVTSLTGALPGVLVVRQGEQTRGFRVSADPAPATSPAGAPQSLIYVALLAAVGGLLLNLMPCVFPVLSFKAVMLMESATVGRGVQRLHGVAYTLGVVVFFAALGGLLYGLKAGGTSIGWGFQLQTPWFVAALAYLLVLVGLSFSGVITVGTSIMGVGSSLADRGGFAGSFATGALAAIVATPCTAPFMGTAVAYALVRPPLESLVIFISLGLGLAAPFLLVAFIPGLARAMPRPGAWMNVFKEAMAFPMYATALWLLWVVGRQTGPDGMTLVLGGLLLIMLALWLVHQTPRGRALHWSRLTAAAGAVALAVAVLGAPTLRTDAAAGGAANDAAAGESGRWVPYSEARLAELREAGTPVFVNMTADWCISCIANERVALSADRVRDAFARHDVVLMKGDWTRRDARITRVLERFGRTGVPLYLLYDGDGNEPRILPQWLTPGIVLDALAELDRDKAGG